MMLRKVRKRREAEAEFNDEDFGNTFDRSAFVQETSAPSTPNMMQTHHAVSPSVSGPGMAGQGAYTTAAASGYGGYGATDASGAALGGAAAANGLQERPKYVYGQSDHDHDDHVSDHAHGAYSSQPQPMQVGYGSDPFGASGGGYGGAYNAQGSYAAYDAQGGYAQATREYQGQEGYTAEGGYAAQGYDQQYAQGYEGQYAAQGYDAQQPQQHPYNQAYDASQYANGQTAASVPQQQKKAAHDDAYGGM